MAKYRRFEYSDTATVTLAPASANAGDFASQVLTPLAQAVISGVAVGALVGTLCWAFWSPNLALPVAGVIGVAVFGAFWLLLLDDARSLLRAVNIAPDATSKPQPSRERLVLVNPPKEKAGEDARRSRFAAFVRDCAHDTSQRRLESLGYSRQEISEWRDALLRLRLAAWRSRDPRRGWTLTAPPDDILARLA